MLIIPSEGYRLQSNYTTSQAGLADYTAQQSSNVFNTMLRYSKFKATFFFFFFLLDPEEKQTTRPTSRKNFVSPVHLDTYYCMEMNAKGGWLHWLLGTRQRQQPGTEAQKEAVNINFVRRHIDVQSKGRAP